MADEDDDDDDDDIYVSDEENIHLYHVSRDRLYFLSATFVKVD